MLEPLSLARRTAFAGLMQPVNVTHAAGVTVSECTQYQIATVIARRSRGALTEHVRTAYGVDLPAGPKRVSSERIAFVGTGPRTWLALATGGGFLAGEIQSNCGETAAVSDQSDGYAVLRLSGPKVRQVFEKGLGVDLHPRAFGPGDAAVTTCSHLGVILWQLDDAPAYEVAVFRSLAADLWHWLAISAAEYGLAVESGRG